jgi:RNA polymerase sigma factor (sigma-70 family)
MSNTRDATSGYDAWSRVLRGDTAAFGEVFDLHRDRVFGQALRLVRSVDDAEDLTALVFLEAWRRRANVRVVDGSIVGWLLLSTNYVVRNMQRTARRHAIAMAKMPRPVDAQDHAGAIHDDLDSLVARNAVGLAFRQLSSRDQDVLTLCVLEELSEAEASAALGVPAGTIKSRLSRAPGNAWRCSSRRAPGSASKARPAWRDRPMDDRPQFDPRRSDQIRNLLLDVAEEDIRTSRSRRRHARRSTAILTIAILAGVAGTGGVAYAVTGAPLIYTPSRTPGGAATLGTVPHWKKNASGQTYGVQGNSPVAPDLIAVQTTTGLDGYAYAKDLDAADGPMPTSPPQAAAGTSAGTFGPGKSPTYVPVYKSDGKTRIGVFQDGN